MKGNELKQIVDRLYEKYGQDEHFIVTNAEFRDGSWYLIVSGEKKEPEVKDAE